VLVLRKVWTVLAGAFVAAFMARGLLEWALGLEGTCGRRVAPGRELIEHRRR